MLPHTLLILALATGWATAADTCDDTTYMTCQAQLNQALGLTDSQPWFRPDQFRYKVEQFYQLNSANGLQTVCTAFRQFRTCMKSTYAACMNAYHFVSATATPYQAYQFVSTFNTMHFTCGAGFQIYLKNTGCMQTTWSGSSSEQLYAYRTAFEMKSDSAPDSACQLANTYMDGWEKQLLSTCGTSARDTQFWACEYARINVFTRFPACNTRCVLPYNGGGIG